MNIPLVTVMKFGGSSIANASNIRRVLSIIDRQQKQSGVAVVLSAAGETTNRLVSLLELAKRRDSAGAINIQRELREFHLDLAEALLTPSDLDSVGRDIRKILRDLHLRVLELADEGRPLTPELTDQVLSVGEQLSSLLVALALQGAGITARHLDSRKLVLTDDRFTRARPQIWETYAKIRWTVPHTLKTAVAVVGGFIGSTADGRTTTLGRGGSDLTAALFGAAMNANTIQIWKDVDGFLTCDPRLRQGWFRLKHLSYREADELARAGAKILHPESIAPARRLRIPVVIRNSFRPESDGTIIATPKSVSVNPVKSIAYRKNVTILELRSIDAEGISKNSIAGLLDLCHQQNVEAEVLGRTGSTYFLGLPDGIDDCLSQIRFPQCCACRIQPHQAILTIVGEGLAGNDNIEPRLRRILSNTQALPLPRESASCSLRFAVPAADLIRYMNLFHDELFRDADPDLFVKPSQSCGDRPFTPPAKNEAGRAQRRRFTTRRDLAFSS